MLYVFFIIGCIILSCQLLLLYNIRKKNLMNVDRIFNVKLQIFCGVFFFLIFIQSMIKLILEDCLLLCNKFLEEKFHVLSKPG